MTLRAVIYARVSSALQRERQTIDSQLSELPRIVEREGWTLVDTIVDDGVSGKTFDRPGFKRVEQLATDRAFDVLVVIDTDRIGRPEHRLESAMLQDFLKSFGIRIFSPSSGMIDLANEDQALLADIRLSVAGWDRRKLIAKMARGHREGVRKGRRYRGPEPYGYRWVPNPSLESRGAYEIVEDEAVVVRLIADMSIRGMSRGRIALELNARGIKSPTSKKRRPGAGKWLGSAVSRILKSTATKGEFTVLKTSNPSIIRVPPILDGETWQRVQASIGARILETARKHKREYLLNGIIKCGECGRGVWVAYGRAEFYYKCSAKNAWRSMGLDGPCISKGHRTSRIDADVWQKISEVLTDAQLLADACSVSVADATGGVDWDAQIAGCRKRLGDLEELEAEVLMRRRRGRLSSAACDRELDAIANDRATVERTLAMSEQEAARDDGGRRRLAEIRAQASAFASKVRGATFTDRRDIVRMVVSPDQGGCVRLYNDGTTEVRGILEMPSGSVNINIPVAV